LIKPVLHFLLQDHRGNQLYLGINHCGILTFQGSRKTHHFRWAEVQKINYEGKMFIVHVTYNEVRNEGFTDPNFCFVSQEPLLHLVLLPVFMYGCETLPLTMME
jgi:hypothetical protein